MIALLFPGQGAQEVGMGQELAESFPIARETFEEANDVLGYDLAAICFTGPLERLTATDICQPALVATSIAAYRVGVEHGLRGDVALGHSLGEYSALVAAGSLPFDQALRLVAERGAAMQAAAAAAPGAMVALLGAADEVVEDLCKAAGEVWPANYNCPGQVVASGTEAGVNRLVLLAVDKEIKFARLAVSGAFHSPLMEPAAERLAPALDGWEPADPALAFVSTITATTLAPAEMRPALLRQLTSPVRFAAAARHAVALGVDRVVELGPGRVLSGLMKRIDRGVSAHQVRHPADLATLATS